MSSIESLESLHSQLVSSFQTSSPDLTSIGKQLSSLKILLTTNGLLFPTPESDPQQLKLARDVLEIGAYWSVRVRDTNAFDRYMDFLKAFYDSSSHLPASENQAPLLGLSLLRLLSSNSIAAFHTTLETLSPELISSSIYIQHPINLERWLMEGSYSKVWRARQEAPKEEYKYFVDGLMGTIRHEIASCEEKAYDSLPLSDAATLLFFDNMQEMLNFANERGWQIDPSTQTVRFTNKAALAAASRAIPKKATITDNLQFAKELESIV